MEQLLQRPLVICGPSGVGKGTMLRALMKESPDTFGFCVSDTTRAIRSKEMDGVDYNFISKDKFTAGIKSGRYIENLTFGDNLYGTSYEAVDNVHQKQLVCVMEIHIDSAQFIKNKTDLKCKYIFISVSGGLKTLEERLRKRDSEDERQIQRRLEASKKELKFMADNPTFFDAILYNDDTVERTLDDLISQLVLWYPDIKSRKKADALESHFRRFCGRIIVLIFMFVTVSMTLCVMNMKFI